MRECNQLCILCRLKTTAGNTTVISWIDFRSGHESNKQSSAILPSRFCFHRTSLLFLLASVMDWQNGDCGKHWYLYPPQNLPIPFPAHHWKTSNRRLVEKFVIETLGRWRCQCLACFIDCFSLILSESYIPIGFSNLMWERDTPYFSIFYHGFFFVAGWHFKSNSSNTIKIKYNHPTTPHIYSVTAINQSFFRTPSNCLRLDSLKWHFEFVWLKSVRGKGRAPATQVFKYKTPAFGEWFVLTRHV